MPHTINQTPVNLSTTQPGIQPPPAPPNGTSNGNAPPPAVTNPGNGNGSATIAANQSTAPDLAATDPDIGNAPDPDASADVTAPTTEPHNNRATKIALLVVAILIALGIVGAMLYSGGKPAPKPVPPTPAPPVPVVVVQETDYAACGKPVALAAGEAHSCVGRSAGVYIMPDPDGRIFPCGCAKALPGK